MKQLFISDLHLDHKVPHIEQLFHHFMDSIASDADELYVLGDLFEAWIGDDAIDRMANRVIQAFKKFSTHKSLYFIHGNRDFLLGDDFLKATGGTLLKDEHFMSLANQNSCLMHGDSFCIDDVEYQAFKKEVRSKEWQKEFLSKSLEERQAIADHIRSESKAKGQNMNAEIMDVNQEEVSNFMQTHNLTLLIHGHTHRQKRHLVKVDGQKAERIVLGDWGNTGSVLIIEENNISLENFSLG